MNTMYVADGLFVKQNDYFTKILFADILYIEAARSYCDIYVKSKAKPTTITLPMARILEKLPPHLFRQIHRSFVVNINHVDRFIGNTLYCDKKALPISKQYRNSVLSLFIILERGSHTD